MNSSKLRGKVLMNLEKSKTVLEILIDRVMQAKNVDKILVATFLNVTCL
jgi:spore coat polysaccharide biosynthesis protein SpsF (cytidylyltransferase family)